MAGARGHQPDRDATSKYLPETFLVERASILSVVAVINPFLTPLSSGRLLLIPEHLGRQGNRGAAGENVEIGALDDLVIERLL